MRHEPVAEHGRLVVAPRDFPTNKAGLCRKGFTAAELLDARDRLTEPLVREHKGGALLAVSWDQALDRIVAGVRAIQAAAGPDADRGIRRRRPHQREGLPARQVRARGAADRQHRLQRALLHVLGGRGGDAAFGIDRGLPFPLQDIPETETVLLVGSNPAETMPPLMQYFEEQRRRGGKLIVVDPRRRRPPSCASLHLQITPGTDAALANGLLHVAISRRLIDDGFIAARTDGFDRVRRIVASYWPDRVERITGVPARKIEAAAHIWGRRATAMVLTGRGPEQQSHGVDNVLAFINLALALGKAGKPFCGYGCLTGQGNGQGGREHGQKADQLPGYRRHRQSPASRAHRRGLGHRPRRPAAAGPVGLRAAGRARPTAASARCWCSARTSRCPRRTPAQIEQPARRARFAGGLRPLPVRDRRAGRRGSSGAQWAEEEGTMTNLEGRVLLRRRRARRRRKACGPISQILTALADRLGAGRHFTADTRATSSRSCAAPPPGGAADYAGITYERIAREDGVFWPCPDERPSRHAAPVRRSLSRHRRTARASIRSSTTPPGRSPRRRLPAIS